MMRSSFILVLLSTIIFLELRTFDYLKHFVIVIPSRNNAEWCEKNLQSIVSQNYENWHAIYLNDASTDATGKRVQQFITKHNLEEKITLINNETRQGALANMVKAVYMCDDWDIIVSLDGDDWFSGPGVLQKLNDVYSNENIWATYGSYQEYPSAKKGHFSRPIPEKIIESNGYRKHPWSSSQLRTFYTWLFKCIKEEDFLVDGKFFQITGDLAYFMPILELSGGRFKYIPDILYIYNLKTSLNDHKINRKLQAQMEKFIRAKIPYQPLQAIPEQFLLSQ